MIVCFRHYFIINHDVSFSKHYSSFLVFHVYRYLTGLVLASFCFLLCNLISVILFGVPFRLPNVVIFCLGDTASIVSNLDTTFLRQGEALSRTISLCFNHSICLPGYMLPGTAPRVVPPALVSLLPVFSQPVY